MTTTKKTQISKEDLEPVVTARSKAIDLATAAEKSMKDARLAELEFKVSIQQLYLQNGLAADCRVDIASGQVTWPEEPVAETTAEEKPKRKRAPKETAPEKTE